MGIKFANFATSTIANVGGIASGDLALSVASGDGNTKYPSLLFGDYFYCVLVDPSANREVIQVTARSGDDFTIVRAQDGTIARSFSQGDKVELRLVKSALDELRDVISSTFSQTTNQIDAAAAFVSLLSTATPAQVDHATDELDGVTVGGTGSSDILTTDGSQNVSGKKFSDPVVINATGTIDNNRQLQVINATNPGISVANQQGGSRLEAFIGYITSGNYALFSSYDFDGAADAPLRIQGSTVGLYGLVTINETLDVVGKATLSGGINDGSSDLQSSFADLDALAAGIGVTIPRQKIVAIGDWDMDATDYVDVAHGLTFAKIIGARAVVRNDADTNRMVVNEEYDNQPNYTTAIGFNGITATTIRLRRWEFSSFNGTNYNSTSYNRGWIIIDYID